MSDAGEHDSDPAETTPISSTTDDGEGAKVSAPSVVSAPMPPKKKAPPKDRRTLYGALTLLAMIVLCLGLASMLLDTGDDSADDGPRIGVVEIVGPIVSSESALKSLRFFRKRESIKAILVRINSPGGAVAPSEEIYRELMRTRKKKPVVVSMETMAASGGYYIAAGATKIVANAGTITGSIGVITQTTNVAELLQLAKIHTETFKTGKFKDTLSPLRPMDDEEKRYVQSLLQKILAQFVADVAKGRGMDLAKVKKVADGRVFTGKEAKGLGLVDELGNFTDALELAAKLAKAKGDPVAVYPRKSRSLLSELLQQGLTETRDILRESVRQKQRFELRAPRF